MNEDKKIEIVRISHTREHFANERTFLAWIRTSLGLMAFGFVLERFSFLMNKIPQLVGESFHVASVPLKGYSSIFGIFLILVGATIALLAFMKYKKNGMLIEGNAYKPSILLDVIVTLAVLLIGFFLVATVFISME